jgi:hypothetical protein
MAHCLCGSSERAIRIAGIVQQESVAPCGPGVIVDPDHVTEIYMRW